MNTTPSSNFAYLAHHDARLVALATQAEQHFAGDPTVTLFKLRQFGEVLVQRAAAKVGLYVAATDKQQEAIDRLYEKGVIGATQRQLFHDLRRVGNLAVHESKGDHGDALHQLRMARELAIWFQRSFGKDVMGVIPQAKRYSRGYLLKGDEFLPDGSPWRDNFGRMDA